jgi:hypothetical protein
MGANGMELLSRCWPGGMRANAKASLLPNASLACRALPLDRSMLHVGVYVSYAIAPRNGNHAKERHQPRNLVRRREQRARGRGNELLGDIPPRIAIRILPAAQTGSIKSRVLGTR